MQRDRFSHSSWRGKFRVAFRGIAVGLKSQTSFRVHVPLGLATLIVAGLLGLELWQWCILIGCVGAVIAMELMNTALESLSRAVTRDSNDWVRDALDMASGAVLVGSITSAMIGAAILLPAVWNRLGG